MQNSAIVITNNKNILSWNELKMDEPGGVIRMTLSELLSSYKMNLDILIGDENELMQLADWRANSETYKDYYVYNKEFIYRAKNGHTMHFQVKYYLNSFNARMYMITRDKSITYVTGILCDMHNNLIDEIDLGCEK